MDAVSRVAYATCRRPAGIHDDSNANEAAKNTQRALPGPKTMVLMRIRCMGHSSPSRTGRKHERT